MPSQVSLYLCLGFPDQYTPGPYPYNLPSLYVPASTAFPFPFCALVLLSGPDSAMLVSCLPCLISSLPQETWAVYSGYPFCSRDASREARSRTGRNNQLLQISTGKDTLWEPCREGEAGSCGWYKVPCGKFLDAHSSPVTHGSSDIRCGSSVSETSSSTGPPAPDLMMRSSWSIPFREERMSCWQTGSLWTSEGDIEKKLGVDCRLLH